LARAIGVQFTFLLNIPLFAIAFERFMRSL
jgi:hypothetical protein